MVAEIPSKWDRETDVVVIGSGTGLAAALAADDQGADVLVLEKAPKIGGTTAVSGGVAWIPNSRPIVESVGGSAREEVKAYIDKVSGGRTPDKKIEQFLDRGPEVVDQIESRTALTFSHTEGLPDYYTHFEGGREEGHGIEPDLYDGDRLGEMLEHVRQSPQIPMPVPFREMAQGGSMNTFALRADFEEIGRREEENLIANGRALIAGLYEELRDSGVEFERNAQAQELVIDDDSIVGVVAEINDQQTTVGAGSVVIAAGGFEWDEEMREGFLRGPIEAPASPPYNEGDGIEMGADVGAQLGNMNEAWWHPVVGVPGEEWEDGSQVYDIVSDRSLPGAIIVNEDGKRFMNESGPYHDIGKRYHEFDPGSYDYQNIPSYQIFDNTFRERYPLAGTVMPGEELPDWIKSGETLSKLAEQIGVDAEGLNETVTTFNEHAKRGVDPEFDRGQSAFDRHAGDQRVDHHPNLAPLDDPPFYAFEFEAGAIGTKGGLVTTIDAAVVDHQDDPIPGLFASSNGTDHIMGKGYVGGGSTIGPNLTYGYIAGESAAEHATE